MGSRSQHGTPRRSFLLGSAAAGAGILGATTLSSTANAAAPPAPTVLANNIGYDATGPKRAVIAGSQIGSGRLPYRLVDAAAGRTVFQGSATYVGPVTDWQNGSFPAYPGYSWTADFSAFTTPGRYVLTAGPEVGVNASFPFWIEDNVLERRALSHIVHYFKDSRSSGQLNKVDRALPVRGSTPVDAHGGWYDAAADWGKHFTQLSELSYFNTLSIPLTAWVLLAAHDELVARNDPDLISLVTWLLDEALHGADYLTRTHRKGASFYSSVEQPEADDLGIDPTQRSLSTRQVDFREGGGLAIAALARASTYPVSGDYPSAAYLAAAEDAFAYLQANNVSLLNDHKENILDDYNVLLAATELFKATHNPAYQTAADSRAQNLVGRLQSFQRWVDYWRADDGRRPFFHPSDAGLPVTSLIAYSQIASPAMKAKVLDAVTRSLNWELWVTGETPNPFGYARQPIQDGNGDQYTGFFFPHNVTPRSQDVWWQGENARLASLATAARLGARVVTDPKLAAALRSYAADQLNWIVGVNPFNVCMLDGAGRDCPLYLEYPNTTTVGSWRWLRSAGGIVNGITGKFDDGTGIEWDPGAAATGPNTDWRWLEQWLPHSTWYLYAAAVGS